MSTVDKSLRGLATAVLLPGFAGHTVPDWLPRAIEAGLGGVVLFGRNVADDGQVAELTSGLRAVRGELVVAIDEEGGDVTRLDAGRGSAVPGNYALSVADDVALTERVAGAVGARLADCGVTVNLAPPADLVLTLDDPANGVRSFGSDPHRAAAHVAAFVRGTQAAGVSACAKHFPGHGASTTDSHHNLAVLPRTDAELRAVELVPFASAVRAGVDLVMTGHLVVPEWGPLPATLNPVALRVLRDELGFTGTVISDALDMKAVCGPGGVAGLARAAVGALAAGVDALCVGSVLLTGAEVDQLADAVVAAVRSGRLPESRLAEAATRVAALHRRPAASAGVDAAAGAGGAAGVDPELGLRAARAAVRVRGELALAGPPLVVDMAVPPSMAAGDVPWGLGPHLAELVPGTQVLTTTGITAEQIAARAAGRPVVLVTRDAHRHDWVRGAVTALATIGLDLVHVETGVPGPDLGVAARVDTHGGARVCLRAAAERIAEATAPTV